ncbi:MAG TPA: metalloregulator ArsR/SmtB family transcription factor, partial [Gemmataceae bacterium]
MKPKRTTTGSECSTRPSLKERPLLTPIQAGGLAAVFKVLANDTRLRLLHALVREEELCVTDLAASVGMKPQAVSNQLQRLSDLARFAHRATRSLASTFTDCFGRQTGALASANLPARRTTVDFPLFFAG